MPFGRSPTWLAVAGILLIMGLPGINRAAASQLPQDSKPVPRFEPGECMLALPEGLQPGEEVVCGYLVVPELYANPDGPTIRLAVIILKASAGHPAPDPMVLNQGGPGGATIDYFFSILADEPLDPTRDMILFDQRGTGYSDPALDCPEIDAAIYGALDENLGMEAFNRVYNAGAASCQRRLVEEGVDLAAFNSLENAHDIDTLRQVLGYEKINLYGVSYGSLLALHTIREHPEGLRSVILDGVVPPQMNLNVDVPYSADYAFTQFFNACAADLACSQAYPGLEKTFFDLVDRMNEQPVELHLVDFQTGQGYTDVFRGDDFLWAVFQMMYAREFIPLLPELIQDVGQGKLQTLQAIQSVLLFDHSVKMGMYWSVYCTEDADFDPNNLDYSGIRPQIAKDQVEGMRGMWQLCQEWGVPGLGSRAGEPVVSDIPVLILNGQFDPITPAPNGAKAARTLSHSTQVTFSQNGHGALFSGDCADQIVVDFMNAPQETPDTSCVEQIPPEDFIVPGEYAPLPIAQLYLDLIARRPMTFIVLGLILLTWLTLQTAPFVYAIAWLVYKLRKTPADLPARPVRQAAWLGVLQALLTTLFLGLFVWQMGAMLAENNLLLLLGMPASKWYLMLLPPVIGLLSLWIMFLAVLGLIREKGYILLRLYQFALSAAGVLLAVFLAVAGLMTAWTAWLR
jgi:pimeloyl-ACP methyl ester carboxylesterase